MAESARTQSGDIEGAVTSSQVYTTGAPIEEEPSAALTSEEAAAATEDNQAQLEEITTPTEVVEDGVKGDGGMVTTQPIEDEATGVETGLSPELQAEVDSVTSQLQAAVDTLPDALAGEVARIEEIMNRRIEQMEITNTAILGAKTKLGVRSGRQRMHREVQTSILGAEERAGIQRISDLEAQKLQLIREAEEANTAKKWELLDKKMGLLLETSKMQEDAIYKQAQLAMDAERLAIQLSQEARAERTSRLDEATALMDRGLTLTADMRSSLDGTYGLGFADALVLASEEAAAAAAVAGELESADKLLSVLTKLPQGRAIEINGVEYDGLKEMDANTYQFNKTDSAGNVTVVTADKTTGEIISVASAGQIDKAKSTGAAGTTYAGESVIGFDEFLSEMEKSEAMSIDRENVETMDQIQNLYEDYTKTLQQENLSSVAKEVMNNPYIYSTLSTTERKKLISEYAALGVDTTFLPLDDDSNDLSSPWD